MLHWMLDNVVVDEGTFMPGKIVAMEASGLQPAPTRLRLYQVYSSGIRRVLRHLRISDRRSISVFGTKLVPVDRYQSDNAWKLPVPRGRRKSSCFAFSADGGDALSPRIYSSRIGAVDIRLASGAHGAIPAGPIQIGVNGEAELKVIVMFAVDPVLSAEVLTGETLVEHMIDNLVDDEGDNPEPIDWPELRNTLLADYRPPGLWTAELSDTTISGDEGDVVEQTLRLTTPSAGGGCFAVSYYDETGEVGETSDVCLVTVNENLDVFVTLDTSALGFQVPA